MARFAIFATVPVIHSRQLQNGMMKSGAISDASTEPITNGTNGSTALGATPSMLSKLKMRHANG